MPSNNARVAFEYRNGGVIETQAGYFNLTEPTFDIEVIAHALSNTCRYNGHCRSFYSVAEHSVLVSFLMERLNLGCPLEGLLHDATEAYLSDVPSPFKVFLNDWKAIDAKLDAAMREHFGLGAKSVGLKTADWIALFMEANELMPSKGEGPEWLDPEGLREKALQIPWKLLLLEPKAACELFLERYRQLTR